MLSSLTERQYVNVGEQQQQQQMFQERYKIRIEKRGEKETKGGNNFFLFCFVLNPVISLSATIITLVFVCVSMCVCAITVVVIRVTKQKRWTRDLEKCKYFCYKAIHI